MPVHSYYPSFVSHYFTQIPIKQLGSNSRNFLFKHQFIKFQEVISINLNIRVKCHGIKFEVITTVRTELNEDI